MDFRVTVSEVVPYIYSFLFPNQYLVTSTFARIQEFAESSFDSDYFTFEEFIDLCYIKDRKISYFEDWSGFNLSAQDLRDFYNIFYIDNNDLTQREKYLYDIIDTHIDSISKTNFYYIIGVFKKSDISHEISHGFYDIDEEYRANMDKLIEEKLQYKSVKKWIKGMGYSDKDPFVIKNEIQAYLATSTKRYLSKMGYKFMWGKAEPFRNYYKRFKNVWTKEKQCSLKKEIIIKK